MKLAFNHLFFNHINQAAIKENGRASKAMLLVETLLKFKVVQLLVWCIETVVAALLYLPIPIYSNIVYFIITHMRGLPSFTGMYARALYYRWRLQQMESNVLIDQNVFFAYPKTVVLKEFCYIDKNVMIMSKHTRIGRRVHVAPRVFVSGGGDLEIEDYGCIATNSNIITSTEVLKNGARCCGPMVSAEQRNVLRSKVVIQKDAFVGANVTVLPGVTIAQGSVVAAGITVSKNTEPWGIYLGAKIQKMAEREPVKWPND